MLQFLIIWITTIAATIGADVSLAFKMIKDIADCGYKIKLDRMKEVSEALNPNVKQMNNFIKLIPIINLMKSFSDLVEYSKVRNKVLDEFSVLDCIEEIINIPTLLKYFDSVVEKGKLGNVLDEIIVQSKVEFNYTEPEEDEEDEEEDNRLL